MLKNHDIIVLSDDWGRHPFSCQHILKRFLKYNRVLWINTVGYRQVNLNIYDIKRSFEKIHNWLCPVNSTNIDNEIHNNLRVINPVCLPFGHFSAVRAFNVASISRAVLKEAKDWNFFNPLLITTLPTSSDLIGRLGEKFTVYYCVDDFTLWPGADGELMRKLENKLLACVDLVVATSEKLSRTRKNGRRQTKLLTHGVDVDHFKSVGMVEPAPEVRDLQVPVVGYYGLVDERCDLSLLTKLARTMEDVTFLIIGAWRVDPGPLPQMSNVRIIRKVAYDDLPSYLAPVSVLILPYRVNELAQSINPLKLKEYLATGLPVVASPLPEIVKLNRFLSVASGTEQFGSALCRALKLGRTHSDELESFLFGQGWDRKAEEFSDMIAEILSNAGRN